MKKLTKTAKPSKLLLTTEKVRELRDDKLKAVVGGTSNTGTGYGCYTGTHMSVGG